MMTNDVRLAYMADQIVQNLMTSGEEVAVIATADHIASFWDPLMRRRACSLLRDRPEALTPTTAAVFRLVEARDHPVI